MTTETPPLTEVSPLSRGFGLGSVFGKTLRDSRRATIIVGGAIGLLLVVVAGGIITQFNTPAAREEIGNIVDAVPPIMQGLAGKPVNVETLGGYIQYKYGGFLPLVTGLWSILALSSTLAGESRRGSLDFLLATPISRRGLAWQKVFAHVLMVAIAMAFIGGATALAGATFATLPGDEISVGAAFAFAGWLGLMALASGSLAFALAPFVGRGSAAGLVAGWASDERTGRLEMLLPTPVPRSRWPLAGGIGVASAIAVMVAVTAAGIAIGAIIAGGELWTPVVGTLSIGLYGAAMAGIGIAIGGLFGPAVAAPAVVAITLITWLIDLVGGDLGIPDAIHQLALSSHMGQPMVGSWDPVGIAACLALAVGGLAIGTLAFARRDLRG